MFTEAPPHLTLIELMHPCEPGPAFLQQRPLLCQTHSGHAGRGGVSLKLPCSPDGDLTLSWEPPGLCSPTGGSVPPVAP